MGIPGITEKGEMSTNLSDDHSPVIAGTKLEEVLASTKVAGDQEVGQSTSSLGGTLLSNWGPSNSKADLSSSDNVDVTTMASPDKKSPARGGGQDDPAKRIRGENQEQHQSLLPPQSVLLPGLAPEPNIRERLWQLKQQVVNPLFKHSKSAAFKKPVNAKALGIYPMYHQIIKCPMDLGTVRKKIDHGEYATMSQCVNDIFLIWTNAKTFNLPGHFVHENAKVLEAVTKDKLAKLECNEAARVCDQPKLPGKKALEVLARHLNEPRPERRMSRKISSDLPGESIQPQQLKKKYMASLDNQMLHCDSILKELLTARLHQAYVEPFLQSSQRSEATGHPMNLYQVQQRLQAGYYQHPLHFATDFRSIISGAYRHATSAYDPVVQHASNLQHNFEILFSKVEFEPVANLAMYDHIETDKSDNGGMLRSLLVVQSQVAAIQNSMAGLLEDLVFLRRQDLAMRRPGLQQQQQHGRGCVAGARVGATGGQVQKPLKRKWPRSSAVASRIGLTSPKAKKQRRQKAPQQLTSTPLPRPSAKSTLTEEQRMTLHSEIAGLKEDDQVTVVQIMMRNGEVLSQDANGYTEIDLGNCSARTIKLIQDYIKKVTASSLAKKRRQQHNDYDSSCSESSDEGEEEEEEGNSSSSSSSSSSADSDSD